MFPKRVNRKRFYKESIKGRNRDTIRRRIKERERGSIRRRIKESKGLYPEKDKRK